GRCRDLRRTGGRRPAPARLEGRGGVPARRRPARAVLGGGRAVVPVARRTRARPADPAGVPPPAPAGEELRARRRPPALREGGAGRTAGAPPPRRPHDLPAARLVVARRHRAAAPRQP